MQTRQKSRIMEKMNRITGKSAVRQLRTCAKKTSLIIMLMIASVAASYGAATSSLAGGGNSAATICAPVSDVLIYSFNVATGSTALSATGFSFTTTGSAVSGTDITNFTLWRNTSNTLTGATSVGVISSGLGAGAHSLSVSAAMAKNTTFYFFITATIPSTATNGRTIIVSAMTNAQGVPITFASAPSFSGSIAASGTQTIGSVGAILGGVNPLCGSSSTTTTFSDATSGGVWSSSNTSVATISSTGVVTGTGSGTTTIGYTSNGCSATVSFGYTTSLPAAISGSSTICPPLPTTLISESFESGFPPSGWGTSGNASIWFQQYGSSSYDPSTGAAEDGNYMAEMNFYSVSSGNALLFTPSISMVNITGGQVSFWVYRDGTGSYPYSCGYAAEGITVYWNTATNATGATTLGFVPRAADGPTTGSLSGTSTPYSSGWYQYTANVPATYTGATNYLLFKAVSKWGDNFYLDNVVVTGNVNGSTTLSDAVGGGVWTSTNTSIATVNSGGVVTGLSSGTATISYTNGCGGVAKTMTVLKPVTYVSSSVCPGQTISLTDATPGGTWTSSNTTNATVVAGTGVVTGVTAGTASIRYSLDPGCILGTTVTINPSPAAIAGNPSLCMATAASFSDATAGGTWSISNTAIATIDPTSGGVTTVTTGTATITYTLPTGCTATKQVTVSPLPVPITGSGSCVTDPINPTAILIDGSSGGSWTSSNTSVASIVSFSGEVTGLIPGTTIITYLLPTGCLTTTLYTISPEPATITGTGIVCANAATYLTDSDPGGSWRSSSNSLATVDPGTGIVTGVSGLSYPIITYTSAAGCIAITTLTVNAAPGTITGSPSVCAGSSSNLVVGGGGTWTSSNPGLASVTPGPLGGGVVSGLIAGNPVITYTLPVTGCFSATTLTVNPVPAAVTPAVATVCYGSTITLNDATPGGTWSTSATAASVSSGGDVSTPVAVSSPVIAAIDYVLSTGCKATNMVTVAPLPIAYNLMSASGATNYCAGSGGIDLQMNVTTVGVNYQLYNGLPIGSPLAGTGSSLDFGYLTGAGTYSATAVDATTGCINNMTGSPVINVDPLPAIYSLSYTGSSSNYCDAPGAPGVDLCISGSQSGFYYELFIDGVAGPIATGTGSPMCFGPQTTVGKYIVIATDPITNCSDTMVNSVTIGKFPLPDVHNVTVTNGGNYCAGSGGVNIGLDYGNTGVSYDLLIGSTVVATVAGANSSLDFGPQTVAGTYSVVATNIVTGCSQSMSGSAVVTILPLPLPHNVKVIGSSSYCLGGTGVRITLDGSDGGIDYQLFNGTTKSGIAVPGTGSALDYGDHTAGSYSILATDATTGCSLSMTGAATVISYPALATYSVTVAGTGHYCAGSTGPHVFLSGSTVGVKYDLYNSTGLTATKTGTGASLDFGTQTVIGSYTVVATGSTGCTANMTGSPVIVMDALPVTYAMTVDNGGFYCAGGTGVHIGLSFSDVGISYQLYKNSVATGSPLAGAGTSIDFGLFTAAATYTIIGTNIATGCQSTMTGSAIVAVNPAPTVYTVTGGGNYCIGGTGTAVGVSGSNAGINYELFNGTASVSVMAGTGVPVSFGSQTAAGLYSVVATDALTGCTSNMAASKVITIDPLPVPFDVTGGGNYCSGGSGLPIGLSNSTTGIDYTLYNGTPVKTLHGTSGLALDFGAQKTVGTYMVVAKTAISGCTNTMNGSATLGINSLPASYPVNGGGGYCAGDAGASVYLLNSEPGVSYRLYAGGVPVGIAVTGTGVRLDLGPQTVAGTYTATGTNMATGCTQNMSGTVSVSINALPTAYTVTGGGTMCAGTPGYHIYLSGSQTGVNYQLLNSGATTGTAMPGTGMALDFGPQTTGGNYTISATNATTGCKNNMISSGTIVVNASPLPFAVTGGGHYCAGGTGTSVGIASSENGINYQLFLSATAIGSPVGGTGGSIDFGPQGAPGVYTVKAANGGTGCQNDMTGAASITVDKIVTPSVTIRGTDGTSCVGDVVTYTAVPTDGGTPLYVWKVGGTTMGTGNPFSTLPVSGDLVTVIMTGNAPCSSTTIASSSVKMNVLPYVMPSATLAVDPAISVCTGTPVTITATPSDDGSAPVYSWLRNSVVIGSGKVYTYTPTSADDGDVIEFRLESSYRCIMADTVFSKPVVMTVDAPAIPDFTISAHLGPVVVGQVDTFIATVKNTRNATFAYQWFVKGTAVPGETMPIYINHDVYNNDVITCEVTRMGACGNQSASQQSTVVLKNLGAAQVAATVADISVVPNPNKGEFTVKGTLGNTAETEVSLQITNMLGQVVYTSQIKTHNGNLNEHISLGNSLANGMYLLNLRSDVVNNVFHIVIEQ